MSHVDIEMLSDLKDLMEDEFKNLLQTYLDDSQKNITEITQAVDSNNADLLRSSAHSLKGSSGNLGAAPLADFCKTLEYMGRDNDLADARNALELMLNEYEIVRKIIAGEIAKE